MFDDITVARFWSKVDKRGPDECWPWMAYKNPRGYGVIRAGGECVKAHRYCLALQDAFMPKSSTVTRHRCDNLICCNPKHLEWEQKTCKRGNIASRSSDKTCQCFDCKEYRRLWHIEWRKNNPELSQHRTKSWRENNKEKHQKSISKWRLENADRIIANKAKWMRENPHAAAKWEAKRRASLIDRTPKWANQNKINKIYKLAKKMTLETGIIYEVDHYYPLKGKTVSGLHVENNLRIITRLENRKKHAKMPEE